MPENVVDLVSTPPPPSPTLVVEEQASVQQSASPSGVYQREILETVKAKVDQDAELKAFFATLPALFQSAHKIQTTAPLYASKNPYANITTTFTRNRQGDVIGASLSVTEPFCLVCIIGNLM